MLVAKGLNTSSIIVSILVVEDLSVQPAPSFIHIMLFEPGIQTDERIHELYSVREIETNPVSNLNNT